MGRKKSLPLHSLFGGGPSGRRRKPGGGGLPEALEGFNKENRGKVWRLRKLAVTLRRFPLKRGKEGH